jgi:hypothetical protein
LTGNIFVLEGAVRRLELKGSIARPLDVVHSGSTTTEESGFSFNRADRVTSLAFLGGAVCGRMRALRIAWRREIRSTRRVFGYEAVNTGSKMAARYKQSIGDVNDEAMMLPGLGKRSWCFASDPLLTPSICRSTHQIPGIPSIVHKAAFFIKEFTGSHEKRIE